VKLSNPNAPSTWLIFPCSSTHASLQNLSPFCFQCSRCSLQLPRYRTVCVKKAFIYQFNFTVFMFVTQISSSIHTVWYYMQFHVTTVGLGTYPQIRGITVLDKNVSLHGNDKGHQTKSTRVTLHLLNTCGWLRYQKYYSWNYHKVI
jgi:hypothetical protein